MMRPTVYAPTAATITLSSNRESIATIAHSSSGTTVSIVVTPSGGIGSYTYLWTVDYLDSGSITINSPTSGTTSFNYTGIDFYEEFDSNMRCTVTDSVGNTAYKIFNVNVSRNGV